MKRIGSVSVLFFVCVFAWSAAPLVSHAATAVTIYSQPDTSGEMLSQQATFQNAWIASESLGNLFLGKDRLTITFTMKDPNASNIYGQPAGVALKVCATSQNLQTYYFTAADRTLLSDGAFHTFTIETGTTMLGTADGETPICVTFFGLSQRYNSTHVKSNAAGTIPFLIIEAASLPMPPPVPQAPEGFVTVYEQSDTSGVMTNPQTTFQGAHIDSASLGNLDLGKDKLYITFTIKDPRAGNVYHQPGGMCIQPFGSTDCDSALQKYNFTDADRILLADQAFHTFMVETGTTTSTYADGTRSVSIGFFNLSQYQYETKVKSNADATIPFLKIQKLPPPDPCATPGACVSNVLFLPGIKGSRLYRPGDDCDAELSSCEDQLWEPGLDEGLFASLLRGAGDDDLRDLFLDAQGASARPDVYVKERDVLDSAGGKGFYASFVADMDALQAEGTIVDWEPVAYDWRLSLFDIVEKGRKTGDRVSYLEATSTPYIEQELRRLAAASKSGKVTIVAHSNGGLVAKALLARLGASEAAALVDDLIFVGVPQSGAPRAVGALLYGAGEGLPFEQFDFLVSKATARELSERSPMAYHLLPSAQYFADANDPAHAVGTFDGTRGFAEERAVYGSTLDTADELYDFLLAQDGGREKPRAQDVREANVLDEALIGYARDTHTATDAWVPPAGVTLYQIAGWGVDTVAGLRFTELPALTVGPFAALSRSMFSPTFVEDGDGVVPVPSALMTSTDSPNVKRYWMDLREYNKNHINVKHGNLLEVQELRDFINGILNNTESLPEFIKLTQPSSQTTDKKLVFILHSPLALQLQDASGNTTGLSGDDSVTEDIPGATYGEFGEVQYIIAPVGSYTLSLDGQAEGTFSLEMQEMSGNAVVSSATIADVPARESTLASLTISGGLETVSNLVVDEDGDGTVDITLALVAGETVSYESPAPPVPPSPSGGSAYSVPDPVSPSAPVAEDTPAAILVVPPSPTVATTVSVAAPPQRVARAAPPPIATTGTQKKVALLNEEPEEARDTPQTASVYAASQQPVLKKLGEVFYTSVYRLWRGLQILFSIK